MYFVLVNSFGGLSLPRNSVVRWTDCPGMAIAVTVGVNQHFNYNYFLNVILHFDKCKHSFPVCVRVAAESLQVRWNVKFFYTALFCFYFYFFWSFQGYYSVIEPLVHWRLPIARPQRRKYLTFHSCNLAFSHVFQACMIRVQHYGNTKMEKYQWSFTVYPSYLCKNLWLSHNWIELFRNLNSFPSISLILSAQQNYKIPCIMVLCKAWGMLKDYGIGSPWSWYYSCLEHDYNA